MSRWPVSAMAPRPAITSPSSWPATRPSAPGRGSPSISRSIPAEPAATAASTPKKPPTISLSRLGHESAERRQPHGKAFLLELAHPAVSLVFGTVEARLPFNEGLAAGNHRRDVDGCDVVANRRRLAEVIGVGALDVRMRQQLLADDPVGQRDATDGAHLIANFAVLDDRLAFD